MAERAYIVTKGVVLRETETKEADKILTLLTADRGKISVIARGVRRKSCKYAACAQQMVYSEWTLYQKGEWYYANEGATAELFNGLRTNLEALALGCYFAELTETVTAPEVPAGALLPHLLNGLYALSALQKPPALVKPAFEIKLLCLAGYEPWRTAAPTAAGRTRSSPCWTWYRASCGAGAAARRRAPSPCPCARIPWRPCGISCTGTPSGSTPSG